MIKRVKIVNSIGIHYGTGQHVFEIDLSNMRGLIGLVGAIGSGKSTFAEMLTPYRGLITRKGFLL
jgi:ABC-type bacteriocin/lantibiotic exporter with double-glycine peptidase domain